MPRISLELLHYLKICFTKICPIRYTFCWSLEEFQWKKKWNALRWNSLGLKISQTKMITYKGRNKRQRSKLFFIHTTQRLVKKILREALCMHACIILSNNLETVSVRVQNGIYSETINLRSFDLRNINNLFAHQYQRIGAQTGSRLKLHWKSHRKTQGWTETVENCGLRAVAARISTLPSFRAFVSTR